jgi:quercetin dioxygenase-like cupin family protein
MITGNLNNLQLHETWTENDARQHTRSAFPLVGVMGSENSAMVYFELQPGDHLGRHTDSAEEVLLILQGTVEVSVGEEQGRISQGEFALVPKMIPHDLRNVGQETVKVLGFFGGANNIVATFDEVWLPNNSRVVDTALVFGQAVMQASQA